MGHVVKDFIYGREFIKNMVENFILRTQRPDRAARRQGST